MKRISYALVLAALTVITLYYVPSFSMEKQSADNTKVNTRDQNSGELSAQDQGRNQTDTELTRKIRQDIVKSSDLSTYAHNIKIITVNGIVTLKGPVKTSAEKEIVLEKAKAIAGASHVVDKMEANSSSN